MGALSDLSNDLAVAVAKAAPSTVLVDSRRRYPASGIALAVDLVLTADHVITRDSNLTVQTAEGSKFAASIAGRDPGSDLAVLRLSEKSLVPAARAVSRAQVGQLVLALGRPDEAGVRASWGIVTSIGGPARTGRGGLLEAYLQTETTPYPGFSGGPLVNAEGQVMGLNTSGLTPGSSLTIPVHVAWPIGEALAKDGSVKRGYLGVRTQTVDVPEASEAQQGGRGVLVVWLENGGPAATGGVNVGDIIVGLGGRSIGEPDDIFAALGSETVGKPIEARILRGGKAQSVRIVVGERK